MQFLGSILLLAASAAWAPDIGAGGGPAAVTQHVAERQTEPLTSDWIVEEADNVCGLTDPRQIANPAEIDYDALLEATSEMKEMKRKGIDKNSPEGQVLYNKAVDRVRSAASRVMKDKGYDSVWKKISHRKGKKVPVITDAVKDALDT
jgi:hypothetical protein